MFLTENVILITSQKRPATLLPNKSVYQIFPKPEYILTVQKYVLYSNSCHLYPLRTTIKKSIIPFQQCNADPLSKCRGIERPMM